MPARQVSQDTALSAIRTATATALDDEPGTAVWIGVDGHGGAGKSTFAARIVHALPRAVLVHVDDFSGPRLATWDHDRFREQVVRPLLAGRAARYQRWDWDRDAGAEWHDVAPGSVIVVEGVSATTSVVGVPWTVQVWVSTPRETRLQRALERDGPDLMPRWLQDWMPSEEAYIAREHPQQRVDLVVAGTEPR